MIKYMIVCPNCGTERMFERPFYSSHKRKFCNQGCASSYNNRVRWADPENRQKHSQICIKAWEDEKLRERQRENANKWWADPIHKQKSKAIAQKAHRTPEARENHSIAAYKRWEDPEYQKFMSQKTAESWLNPETRANRCKRISQAAIENWANPEFRQRMETTYRCPKRREKLSKLQKASWANPERIEQQRKRAQERWDDPKTAKEWAESFSRRPTKPEMALLELLHSNGYGKYKYAGDGSFVIGRKNPDFVCLETNKVIELFGSYWHDESEIEPRIEYFAEHGFDTLIIWDYELDHAEQLLTKLKEFHQGIKLIEYCDNIVQNGAIEAQTSPLT